MKIYTDTEFQQQSQASLEYEQIEFDVAGFDEVGAYKNQWSETQYRCAILPSGVAIDIFDEQIHLDQNCLVEHDDRVSLIAKFYLKGCQSVICPALDGVATEYAETSGQSYLFYLPNIEEIEQTRATDHLQMLRVEIDLAYIKRFINELNAVPKQLQKLINAENPQRFHLAAGKLTPQMQTTIQHIWHHPYQGAIARMYLEGKILELIAMQLSQLTTNLDCQTTSLQLKPKEIDSIHNAKKILLHDLDNPPTIQTLAQTVGISDRKLQHGFKQFYGTTVFNYLQNYRLEQAKLMLREGKLSVATVANNIGYTHLGHFSAAFKRKFGITPRDCLRGQL